MAGAGPGGPGRKKLEGFGVSTVLARRSGSGWAQGGIGGLGSCCCGLSCCCELHVVRAGASVAPAVLGTGHSAAIPARASTRWFLFCCRRKKSVPTPTELQGRIPVGWAGSRFAPPPRPGGHIAAFNQYRCCSVADVQHRGPADFGPQWLSVSTSGLGWKPGGPFTSRSACAGLMQQPDQLLDGLRSWFGRAPSCSG
jgi:hypothetical protein